MAKMRKRSCARRATWLAFGLVALAALRSTAHERTTPPEDVASVSDAGATHTPRTTTTSTHGTNAPPKDEKTNSPENVQAAEALRAYNKALVTLTSLTAHPPIHTQDPFFSSSPNSNSLLSQFLPNLQGQGPLGSAFRILVKLSQHSWVTRLVTGIGKENLGLGSKRKDDELRGKAIKVIDLLQHSADLGNSDALYTLAQISMFPPSQHFDIDPRLAYDLYSAHASNTGNATSQAMLAFFHATGYRDVVPINQAKSQLYFSFAAQGGDRGAQMALGYRYWSGIGTLEDCSRAMRWYEAAAEQTIAKFLSGPPGGRTLPHTPTRLSDLEGGVYGPGASVASTGLNANRPAIKAGLARAAGETWEDVLEYYLFNADRGETDFAYRLGKIFYQGSIYVSPGGVSSGSEGVGAIPRDYTRARHYFLRIARQFWVRDPPNPAQHATQAPIKDEKMTGLSLAAASAGYLGRMYLRGEGVKADVAIAKMWFERGSDYADRECQNGLAIIYRDGLAGVKPDMKKAVLLFMAAAQQDLVEAQVNLGKFHYQRGDIKVATGYFETAVRHGSPFEAYYYLGQIHATQAENSAVSHVRSGSCSMAVSFYKIVTERGVWDDDLLREAEAAWATGTEKSKEVAMLKWWIAAERGSEIAQNNLAYILDQDRSLLRLTRFSPMTFSNDTARLSLTHWTRSAAQRNIDALVKVGDYYYHGLGVPDSETERLEKAARYYQSAADTQLSALAMWNLGWMYENGVGVPQDFHLAKRHYDLALETNAEAYLPIVLSLAKLHLRSIWHTLRGGQNGLNIWNNEPENQGTASEQQAAGGTQPGKLDGADGGKRPEAPLHDERITEEEDGPWYLGKAREDFSRRRRQDKQAAVQGQDVDDPIQWARKRRNAEQDRDGDFGPEDYFDAATRRREEQDDDFGETMLLVLLCLSVSILLYVRTRLMDRMRREQQQQQPPQPGNGVPPQPPAGNPGVFPPPGDPARDDWNIAR
ncbi:hypothetical protein HGRIS_002036 [Hohenbuehelia grisea]|uniref:HCP-like protein n=1 Tax=Hohenbuehelia grisea TaxID=104357 RepID=A0ABR3JJ85_9AGAR